MRPDLIAALLPRHRQGVRPNKRGHKGMKQVIAFDIETSHARPFAMAVYCPEGGLELAVALKKRGDGLLLLLEAIESLSLRASGYTIACAHNLRFDLGVLVHDYLRSRGENPWGRPDPNFFDLSIGGARLVCYFGRPCFGSLRLPHCSILLLDTFAYFVSSLNRAAEGLGLAARKLAPPKFLGTRVYSLRRIRPYMLQDAKLAHALGWQIARWWQDYEVRPSISAPQFSARVFTHRYVTRPWHIPPTPVEHMAMLSYHGGKNGFYKPAGWYHAESYDIRSAYPWAMTKIPSMTRGQWEAGAVPKDGAWGFVAVTGKMPNPLPYPIFYTPDFKPLGPGEAFRDLVVTTQEYDTLRDLFPKWRPVDVASACWVSDDPPPSDLARFAQEIYRQRLAATSPTEVLLYKLLGNSLYGKFIARTPVSPAELLPELQSEKQWKRGQLFYPVVASWITALVRARITRLEYAYDVIHTSTDGFLTVKPLPRAALSTELGGLKHVNSGPLLVLRNKLYLHFDPGGKLQYFALHGFQGDPPELWKMLRQGRPLYKVERLRGWLESARSDGLPYAPVSIPMRLHLPELLALKKGGQANPFKIRPRW